MVHNVIGGHFSSQRLEILILKCPATEETNKYEVVKMS